ncbi:hypothetical protein LB452_00330 [Psychroflexus sp. CAK8W]|uniref:AsmA-like C-terminal region n=1 Tax=Psychroflexus longus TaxID=2873596 RepID=A0ABS7XF82_9FLAO|nr:hypothetical protein [Psychroflexus longus]MBZ9777355.1 hypothetical protein [Psychroflexus longus]
MKIYLRYILIFLILVIAGYLSINFLVSKRINTLLSEEKNLTYSSISINSLTGNLGLVDVDFSDDGKQIYIETIDIDLDLIHYIINSKIKIQSVDADGFDLKIISSPDSEKISNKKLDFTQIDKLQLKNSKIRIRKENKAAFEISNLKLEIEDLQWSSLEDFSWLGNKTLRIEGEDLRQELDLLHDLKSEKFLYDNARFTLSEFSIEPKFKKSNYVKYIETEKDLMSLKSKTIQASGFDFENQDNLKSIVFNKISIDSTSFNIYRDKTITDDMSIKTLYSESLRNLNFKLSIDSLLVSNLNLTYQELIDKDLKPGQIQFNSIQAEITNIHNSLKADHPNIKVQANAKFTDNSEILFNYNFVPDHEQFYVSTHLRQIKDSSINDFFGPAMRMKLGGEINDIKTNIIGNNSKMNGDFSIAYKKLKLNIIKKDGSKNNFASLLSNVFVKNKDVDDKHKIEILERDNTKSFWNYVWNFHFQGLKKSLL